MPVDIQIRNFQSIAAAKIRVDGLTGISGTNNAGKSAVMRAVRGVFQNTPGSAYVRHGAEKCEVTLSFDDGTSIEWVKGPKVKPTYRINGAEPIHPGRGVPDEVLALGVAPVKFGQQDVWPTIADQMTGQVFLLDQPGSVLAEAVADMDRVAALNGALRFAESDRRVVSATLKVREKDEKDQQVELDTFAELDPAVAKLALAETARKQAERIRRAILKLRVYAVRLKRAQASVTALKGLEGVRIPPALTSDDLTLLSGLREYRTRHTEAKARVDALSGVGSVVVPAALSDDDLTLSSALREFNTRLTKARSRVDTLSGVSHIETPEWDADTLTELDSHRDLKRRLRDSASQVATHTEAAEVAGAALTQAEAEVLAALEELGGCPTCGSEVLHDHG